MFGLGRAKVRNCACVCLEGGLTCVTVFVLRGLTCVTLNAFGLGKG